uniref:T-box domain-containing protein n=1 Tax=Caenorhabditis tropicalis TaxID=1561998 RepID=A0A1I7U965_9PELO
MSSPIDITLSPQHDSIWKECHKLDHEMIITTAGRRIFPTLEFAITGLEETKSYTMCLQLDFVDDKKSRRVGGGWHETVSQERKEAPRMVYHHDGAQSGKVWMERFINFDQIRITNQKSKENVNPSFVHLFTQHRYIPVLTVYEEGGNLVHTARLEHTQFITVTSYHNQEINNLKKNANPYSTGSRDERRLKRSAESGCPAAKRQKTETTVVPQMPDFNMFQALLMANQQMMTMGAMASLAPPLAVEPVPSVAQVKKEVEDKVEVKPEPSRQSTPPNEIIKSEFPTPPLSSSTSPAPSSVSSFPSLPTSPSRQSSVSPPPSTPPMLPSASPSIPMIPFMPTFQPFPQFYPFGYPFNPFFPSFLPQNPN